MRAPTPASVIVVSRQRPAALCRCLVALSQQDHPRFEVIVVSDALGRFALSERGFGQIVKLAAFEEANISAARNRGLALAAGELVAFIDDDSAAEPTWLSRLLAPFEDTRVSAATGHVIGRNGISLQWRARWVDSQGREHPLETDASEYSLHEATPGAAVKTEGTNMAFRRALLARMGGFDPAYRFYLDETDLNMRQAHDGQITAVVPMAHVHHGFAEGPYRRADRVPRSLLEIGASTAVFLRKYTPEGTRTARIDALRAEQRRRLLQHMVSGAIDPRDVGRLLVTLEDGLVEGGQRSLAPLPPVAAPEAAFTPLPGTGPRPGRVVFGWWWQRSRLRTRALAMAQQGAVPTILRFSPGVAYHQMRYHEAGFWEQTGGVLGRSTRDAPFIRPGSAASRHRDEVARIAAVRPVDTLIG